MSQVLHDGKEASCQSCQSAEPKKPPFNVTAFPKNWSVSWPILDIDAMLLVCYSSFIPAALSLSLDPKLL